MKQRVKEIGDLVSTNCSCNETYLVYVSNKCTQFP